MARTDPCDRRVTHVTRLPIIAVTRARTLYMGRPVTCVTDASLVRNIPMAGGENEGGPCHFPLKDDRRGHAAALTLPVWVYVVAQRGFAIAAGVVTAPDTERGVWLRLIAAAETELGERGTP